MRAHAALWVGGLRGFNDGFVHQQNRDVVPNWVNAAALGALQTLAAIVLHNVLERLLAGRADQNLQEILRNHAEDSTPLRSKKEVAPPGGRGSAA
jgi:hypothetical protein